MVTLKPIFKIVNTFKLFIMMTDINNSAIGIVLSQIIDKGENVITFYSKKLTDTQTRWTISKWKKLTIIACLDKWCCVYKGTILKQTISEVWKQK